jgi:hypothetical protein
MIYPCPVCANTMLPSVTYPSINDCYNCKGTGLVEERRTRNRRQNSDRRKT